eukprot:TRINITY_DN19757_c0_g1_i2.p1 TRINITY_DN19757_c0_g1~~TRINITY_DN19757_c0_g1_i2.p1  ORF type:complete len:421 (-),score=50.03 TRINITY_DN19757_c0_g1_i2:231-1493(-)
MPRWGKRGNGPLPADDIIVPTEGSIGNPGILGGHEDKCSQQTELASHGQSGKRNWRRSLQHRSESHVPCTVPIVECTPHHHEQVCYLDAGRIISANLSLVAPLNEPELPIVVKDFRDTLRAVWFYQQQGLRDACKVSALLGRSENWVLARWKSKLAAIAGPPQLPPFIRNYEVKMLQSGVEPFRPAQLIRGFVEDCGELYEVCRTRFAWEQAMMRSRNQVTGEVTKTSIESTRQDCTIPGLRCGIDVIDSALDRARGMFDIKDPGVYLTCNWYPDGQAHIASHRHDFWSAIISFGASRVFLLDDQQILMGNGDLLVFGTQKHAVPRMPQVTEGRISICIFWYPERMTPSFSLQLSATSGSVCAASRGGDMAALVMQQLAAAGLSGEVVSSSGPAREQDFESDDDDDPELALALEQSMLER